MSSGGQQDHPVVGEVHMRDARSAVWTVPGLLRHARATAGGFVRSSCFSVGALTSTSQTSQHDGAEHLGVFLGAQASRSGAWPKADFTLHVLNSAACTVCSKDSSHTWNPDQPDWGFTTFCSIADFEPGHTVSIIAFLDITQLDSSDELALPAAAGALSGAQFYGSEELADCTVVAGEDGRRFPAHRFCLSSASPVFKAMFTSSSSMAEGTSNRVPVHEVPADVVELLLQQMYGCEAKVPMHQVLPLFKAAEQYQVAAAKVLILKALVQPTVLLHSQALAQLLPQALALGEPAAAILKHLLRQASRNLEVLQQQPAFLCEWQLGEITAVLQQLPGKQQQPQQVCCLQPPGCWPTARGGGSTGHLRCSRCCRCSTSQRPTCTSCWSTIRRCWSCRDWQCCCCGSWQRRSCRPEGCLPRRHRHQTTRTQLQREQTGQASCRGSGGCGGARAEPEAEAARCQGWHTTLCEMRSRGGWGPLPAVCSMCV